MVLYKFFYECEVHLYNQSLTCSSHEVFFLLCPLIVFPLSKKLETIEDPQPIELLSDDECLDTMSTVIDLEKPPCFLLSGIMQNVSPWFFSLLSWRVRNENPIWYKFSSSPASLRFILFYFLYSSILIISHKLAVNCRISMTLQIFDLVAHYKIFKPTFTCIIHYHSLGQMFYSYWSKINWLHHLHRYKDPFPPKKGSGYSV